MAGKEIFTVIGGDLRQLQLAKMLCEDGNEVSVYGVHDCDICGVKVLTQTEYLDCVAVSDYIILPLPLTGNGVTVNAHRFDKPIYLKDIFCAAKKGCMLFGGMVDKSFFDLADELGLQLCDYFQREELTVLNAIPTAEGAVQIAMEETPFTIHGSSCMVTGYGRVGRRLAELLKALGANVMVAARKYADLAWIKAEGYEGIKFEDLKDALPRVDILFNTVPAVILEEEELSYLKADSLIIDLASKPGGVGFDTAKRMGLKVIWALSLPGKVAPITSGTIIKDTIVNMIRERGREYGGS